MFLLFVTWKQWEHLAESERVGVEGPKSAFLITDQVAECLPCFGNLRLNSDLKDLALVKPFLYPRVVKSRCIRSCMRVSVNGAGLPPAQGVPVLGIGTDTLSPCRPSPFVPGWVAWQTESQMDFSYHHVPQGLSLHCKQSA